MLEIDKYEFDSHFDNQHNGMRTLTLNLQIVVSSMNESEYDLMYAYAMKELKTRMQGSTNGHKNEVEHINLEEQIDMIEEETKAIAEADKKTSPRRTLSTKTIESSETGQICEKHQVPFIHRKNTEDGSEWLSHKDGESWCWIPLATTN